MICFKNRLRCSSIPYLLYKLWLISKSTVVFAITCFLERNAAPMNSVGSDWAGFPLWIIFLEQNKLLIWNSVVVCIRRSEDPIDCIDIYTCYFNKSVDDPIKDVYTVLSLESNIFILVVSHELWRPIKLNHFFCGPQTVTQLKLRNCPYNMQSNLGPIFPFFYAAHGIRAISSHEVYRSLLSVRNENSHGRLRHIAFLKQWEALLCKQRFHKLNGRQYIERT